MSAFAPDMPSVDHCVLPVGDLGVARARLEALGFTVAPEGRHPFGTANACVYFEDDTFLEPLVVADRIAADAAISEGNVFVARDRAFRARHGEEGFSALVLASSDADLDHSRFGEAGISAGSRLDFSRPYRDAEGHEQTVSFRLAFASPAQEARSFFFGCERVNAPSGGRGVLAAHRNGVQGLVEVIGCAANPGRFAPFLSSLTGAKAHEDDSEVSVAARNARIIVMTPGSVAMRFGLDLPAPDDDLMLSGLVLGVSDLGLAEATLCGASVEFRRAGSTLVVPGAPGQGAFLAFREAA